MLGKAALVQSTAQIKYALRGYAKMRRALMVSRMAWSWTQTVAVRQTVANARHCRIAMLTRTVCPPIVLQMCARSPIVMTTEPMVANHLLTVVDLVLSNVELTSIVGLTVTVKLAMNVEFCLVPLQIAHASSSRYRRWSQYMQ